MTNTLRNLLPVLTLALTLTLGACSEAAETSMDETPETSEATSEAVVEESDEGDAREGYQQVAQEMDEYWPGEGWGEVSTTTEAVDAACDSLGRREGVD